jgi:uncharacterized protein
MTANSTVNESGGELTRRDLLQLCALTSLSALVGPVGSAATDRVATTAAKLPRHAELYPLAPGAIAPHGWLRLYLQKQADGLGGHLPKVSWPFTEEYWSGKEDPPETDGWWPWEQQAYWIDGATRCALALGDETFTKRAVQALDYTLGHAHRDGYLGPGFARYPPDKGRKNGYLRWPHTVLFRALTAYAEASGDSRVAVALQGHYLADEYRIDYGNFGRDVTNVEGMLWTYAQTGDRRLLTLAEKAWKDFLVSSPPSDRESGDLHPDRVFANTPIKAHGVTYIEKAKLPAILYMHTGNRQYLRFALAAQQRIFDHHMLIDGIPSASEDYRGTSPLDAHESCDISDHTWSWGYLLQATSDGIWADRIERACFNAGFGAIKKDWKAVQYFSCPNQAIATENSSHVPYIEASKGWMAYCPNPGQNTACCASNIHRFFPNYVHQMWMADRQGGLAAILYGASTVRGKVGTARAAVEIRQETDYPFGEDIYLTLGLEKAVKFPLSLRIPKWCKNPSLAVNGKAISLPKLQKGFVRLERTFHPGDRITLVLPMSTAVSTWPDNGLGLEHGPLVYALPVKEEWRPYVSPRWSTAEFPDWNATPQSPWNYALTLGSEQINDQVNLERKPMTSDPWLEPPVTLTVALRKLSGWQLLSPEKHPERLQTPPLPSVDRATLATTELERVALVPYGSTQLRMTIFPTAHSEHSS